MRTIIGLMLLWLLIDTISIVYLNVADTRFLKFEQLILNDNLKNEVVSGGKTYHVVDMALLDYAHKNPDLPIWTPAYADDATIDKLVGAWRVGLLTLKEREDREAEERYQLEKTNAWFQSMLKGDEKDAVSTERSQS